VIGRIAREDPSLAARLIVMTMPAAVARLPVSCDLVVSDLGSWRIKDGRMEPLNGQSDDVDFRLTTDAAGLASLAAGDSPLKLMLTGRVRIRGSRRQAAKLRALADAGELTIADALRAGAELDADAIFRALPYVIDPDWTRGHAFVVGYHLDPGGSWYVHVADGGLSVTTGAPEHVDSDVSVSADVYRRMAAGDLSPNVAMRDHLVVVRGKLHPVTLLGRWIDRSQGRDDQELRREERQRVVQANRVGSWGSAATGRALPAARPVAEPGHEGAGDSRGGGADLMGYGELYALWERQNWRAHELDFSVDKEQWLTTPADAQESMTWSLGGFYIGEERVTADLAPFLAAAPSGEVEIFLATQLVDEARHTAFFDRFGGEVMALDADDLRGRMREVGEQMLSPWAEVFDDGLRDVARRIQAKPDDLGLLVEGITTYHLIIEGVLAMTGQRFIIQYLEDHGLYPGFAKGFSLVERDEHRHIAFGVRFLRDVLAQEPQMGAIVERRVAELVPKAAHVFVPPYAESPRHFLSYGYDSAALYGFAYRKLKRRMAVLGLEVPPPEELMPGPIATPEQARAAGAPV
jgi:ribonucleoside-diphosphate reductase beta chain